MIVTIREYGITENGTLKWWVFDLYLLGLRVYRYKRKI